MASFISENAVTSIRESVLSEGLSNLRNRIKNVDVELPSTVTEKKSVKPKYSKQDIAEKTVELYKTNIKQQPEQEKEKAIPCTIASRANIRALSNSLANIRNGGFAGPTTEFTPSANGDVNPGRPGGYNALVVAGTEMTLEDYKEEVESRMEACWAGYKKKGMKKMFGKMYPNCVKEERKPGETAQEYKERMQKKYKGAKLKTYDPMEDDNFDHDEAEKSRGANTGKPKFESALVDELKDKLVEMDNHSWQAIDKVMRELAKEHDITPKELHKQFKAESNGMIPDDWAKKHAIKEEAGFMPLSEAVQINELGNVYEVSLMWRAHTRRLKFFWPEVGEASKEEMQKAVEMFYPGGKLISFYKSMHPSDNQNNFMVIVPPLRESVWLPENAWEMMTEEESLAYEIIVAEEGEPISPPMMIEGFDGFEIWVEDHSTGEEYSVIFQEGSLHDWFSKSKSKDGKPGWVQSDGSPCANEKGETKTPKCYSSQRLAGLKKTSEGRKKIRSADARKSRQDPGQQSKSGGAKPTYVRTFKDSKDLKKHPSGDTTKDKKESFDVMTRYKVWPSAYEVGSLVKLDEDDMKGMTVKSGHKRSVAQGAGLTEKGAAAYRRKNPGSKLGTAVTTPPSKLKPGSKAANRRKSFCARSRGWTGERGKAARRRWNC